MPSLSGNTSVLPCVVLFDGTGIPFVANAVSLFRSSVLVLTLALLPAVASARVSPPREAPATARAIRTERAPVLDGRDDDAIWLTAPLIEGFRQFAPAEDAPTAFRTTTRVVYDSRNI